MAHDVYSGHKTVVVVVLKLSWVYKRSRQRCHDSSLSLM